MKKDSNKRFISFLPCIGIVIVWMIFAFPYFIQGRVPYPSTYQVNHFAPWSSDQKYWGRVKNAAMPDIIGQMYPWRYLTITTWKGGAVPFWNPYSFAGTPHLANFQSAVFSPTTVLFFILPFLDAWSISVLIQPLIAGIGMYLFVRSLGRHATGAVISSITFMFCGFMVVWMEYGTLSLAISFLPWVLFGMHMFYRTKKYLYLLFPVIGIPFSVFAGHFQTSLYLLLYSVAYGVTLFFHTRKRVYLSLFLAVFAGIGIACIQLLPSIQFYQYSVRSGIFITGGGIRWEYLPTLFAPNYYGNAVTRNDWFGYYAEWASFIGIIPLFLVALAAIKNWSYDKLFFLIAGFGSLLLAIDSPLEKLIGLSHIPVLSTSTPSRIIVLASFSFAVLASYGWDTLAYLIEEHKIKRILPALLAVSSIILLAWAASLFSSFFASDKRSIAERNLLIPTALFVVVVAGVSLLTRKKLKYGVVVFGIILIVFTSADSLLYANKWIPFDPRIYVFPEDPVIPALQKEIGHGRVFGNLGAQVETYYKIPSLEGYDPLYSKRYGEFIMSAGRGVFAGAERSVVQLSRRGKYTDRVIDLLGVTTIFQPIADTNQNWAYPVWENPTKYSVIYHDTHFQLFHNNTVMNRPSLFYDYQVVVGDIQAIKTFYTDSFPYRTRLILAQNPAVQLDKTGTGSAQIVSESSLVIHINANSTSAALLFLPDTYYPGWGAVVNGKMAEIMRADYAFRAIVIPKGKSDIEFRYRGII